VGARKNDPHLANPLEGEVFSNMGGQAWNGQKWCGDAGSNEDRELPVKRG